MSIPSITPDIKPQWLNVIRRMQSLCAQNNGIAIIDLHVVINESGTPICWTEPKLHKVEPRSASNEIVNLLCE